MSSITEERRTVLPLLPLYLFLQFLQLFHLLAYEVQLISRRGSEGRGVNAQSTVKINPRNT